MKQIVIDEEKFYTHIYTAEAEPAVPSLLSE